MWCYVYVMLPAAYLHAPHQSPRVLHTFQRLHATLKHCPLQTPTETSGHVGPVVALARYSEHDPQAAIKTARRPLEACYTAHYSIDNDEERLRDMARHGQIGRLQRAWRKTLVRNR